MSSQRSRADGTAAKYQEVEGQSTVVDQLQLILGVGSRYIINIKTYKAVKQGIPSLPSR